MGDNRHTIPKAIAGGQLPNNPAPTVPATVPPPAPTDPSTLSILYVYNLPRDVTSQELLRKFAFCVEPHSAKALLHPETDKVYGYVNYETYERAEQAMRFFNGQTLRGFEMRVEHEDRRNAQQKLATKVFVKIPGGLATLVEFYDRCKQFGKIVAFNLVTKPDKKSQFGYVLFLYAISAQNAIAKSASNNFGGWRVERYKSKAERVQLAHSYCVRFKNLPEDLTKTEFDLLKFGYDATAHVKINAKGYVTKGHGYLVFREKDKAEEVIALVNGLDLFQWGKRLYARIVVPKQKRKEDADNQRVAKRLSPGSQSQAPTMSPTPRPRSNLAN